MAGRLSRALAACVALALIVMVVAIVFHVFFGWPDLWLRILSRLAVLPVVAGVSYEIIRFAADSGRLGRIVIAPFLSLQYLTTREPDLGQAEVALTSLNTAMGTGDDEELPEGQPVKESMEDNS